jgi:uncharacterized protein with PIN domain
MKFIADVMLGRLAKRLRLIGFDVLYDRLLNDNDIIRLSLEQNRKILTRDAGLATRPLAANHLFIKNDLVQEQVEQVLSIVSLETRLNPLTRCSDCNILLVSLDKHDTTDLVPPHVYAAHDEFLHCTSCERIFWRGSHVKSMALPAGKKKADLP